MKKRTEKYMAGLLRSAIREEKKKHRGVPARSMVSLEAPPVFSIHNSADRIRLLEFIGAIRERLSKNSKKTIVLNFTNTRRFVVDGALYFLAELSEISSNGNNRPRFLCRRPKNQKASQVMKHIGLYRLMGVYSAIRPRDKDVVSWCTAYGQDVDGEKYENVLGKYDGTITEAMAGDLYVGITEAMVNVIHHAYITLNGVPSVFPDGYRPWWMFSQERDGRLTVAICDLGVGIPRSLPRQKPGVFKRVLGRIAEPKDADLIAEAVQDSISRLPLAHRGKGLGQIVRSASESQRGEVRILSGRGWYNAAEGHPLNMGDYSNEIRGTMIIWQVQLRPEAAV